MLATEGKMLSFLSALMIILTANGASIDQYRCEPLRIQMCKDFYNETMVPNLLGHLKQEQADLELVDHFIPMIESGCSPHVRHFLCATYVPKCSKTQKPLPPCRSLCLAGRERCNEVSEKMGIRWRLDLNCDTFPDSLDADVCIGGNYMDKPDGGTAPPLPKDEDYTRILQQIKKAHQRDWYEIEFLERAVLYVHLYDAETKRILWKRLHSLSSILSDSNGHHVRPQRNMSLC